MDHVTVCEPSELPVGAYLFEASILFGADWIPSLDMLQIEADSHQQAAERAAEWCVDNGGRGKLYLITGDDSSRQIATIDGADWRLQ